jgi:hypothetical protein
MVECDRNDIHEKSVAIINFSALTKIQKVEKSSGKRGRLVSVSLNALSVTEGLRLR